MKINFRITYIILLMMLGVMMLLQCGCASRGVVWQSAARTAAPAAEGAAQAGDVQADNVNDDSDADNASDTSGGIQQAGEAVPEAQTEMRISVHVCGAVQRPGVYQLPASARLIDAVEAAGGFTEDADTEWCNQARFLSDEEQVRIYTQAQTAQMSEEGAVPEGTVSAFTDAAGVSQSDGRININTASAAQLESLSGIGPSRAQAIIAWREEHGAFAAIEDIMNVSGIKDALFSQIKDSITV